MKRGKGRKVRIRDIIRDGPDVDAIIALNIPGVSWSTPLHRPYKTAWQTWSVPQPPKISRNYIGLSWNAYSPMRDVPDLAPYDLAFRILQSQPAV